jgi:hypothetical protein
LCMVYYRNEVVEWYDKHKLLSVCSSGSGGGVKSSEVLSEQLLVDVTNQANASDENEK